MNNKIRIAILDSGVNTNHPALSTANINGCSLKYDDETNSIYVGTDYMDEVGHGTAVASIIYSVVSEADIFMYKVLDSNLTINSNALMEILDYINQN